jgi:hypothetical protein
MMHYWYLLWDWNVIESVRSVHSFFEGLAIAFFALLVLFDILAHLCEDKNKDRGKKLERIGLYFFGLAILAEIAAHEYSNRNDELSEREIRGLSAISQQARLDANAAIGKAKSASDEADRAKIESGKARDVAGKAEALARGARKEADSFEKDIKDAKRDASEAKTLLSEVRQLAKEAQERAASAEKGTERLTTRFADRTLTDAEIKDIGDTLRPFAGQEYEVETYWETPECLNISNRIHLALLFARWKYIPPERGRMLLGGVTGINISRHPEADDAT